VDHISSFHGINESLKASVAGAKLLVAGGEGAKKQGPRVRDMIETAKKRGIPVEQVSQAMLDRLDPENKGIILAVSASAARPGTSLEEFLSDPPDRALVLVLDHIEDPHNFGAILRSADAFGASLVVAPLRRASPLSEAATRASAGAAAWVPLVFVQNLADAVRRLKNAGFWVYAADMGGEALPGLELPARSCFVLGNEGEGVSRLLSQLADGSISIPMKGHVDSLNVSVAAALVMYEFSRKDF
jgi:23S rRNA (guanosine2251-2'-O)-methyltransferase